MTTRIKICGLVHRKDAFEAARSGADLLGFVFAESPRRLPLAEGAVWMPELRAAYPDVMLVGVFVRPAVEEVAAVLGQLPLDRIQVHGLPPNEGEGLTDTWVPRSSGSADRLESRGAESALIVPWIRAGSVEQIVACAERAANGRELDRARSAATQEGPWALLADTPGIGGAGGTGRSSDWTPLAEFTRRDRAPRILLAGGLAADNVGVAIAAVRPWGVDASSRLEVAPGRKDARKIAAFIAAVRMADHDVGTRSHRKPADPGNPQIQEAP